MSSVCAQGLRYRVEIDAPRDLARTLRQGLSLVRWQSDAQMTPEQLGRIADGVGARSARGRRDRGLLLRHASRRASTKRRSRWKVTLKRRAGRAHARRRGRHPLQRAGDAGRRGAQAVRAGARALAAAPRRAVPPGRLGPGEARARCASSRAGATPRPRIADSRPPSTPRRARRRSRSRSASGPAFRFGAGARHRPEALRRQRGREPEPDPPRRHLRPRRGARLPAPAARDRLLRERAGRPRHPSAARRRGAAARLGDRGDLAAHRDRHQLHHRRRAALRARATATRTSSTRPGASRPACASTRRADPAARFRLAAAARGALEQFLHPRQAYRHPERDHAKSSRSAQRTTSTPVSRRSRSSARCTSSEQIARRPRGLPPGALSRLSSQLPRTDDLVLPRLGIIGTAEIGGAPPEISTERFLRVVANMSVLYPLSRAGDLLLRGQAGVVAAETRQGIPSTFLFRTGGDQTVRGYAFESLGVRQGDATVGGRRLLLGSIEYTHWIGDSWGPAVFVDAGNAWDSGATFNPALGYGVGVRFRTPIGPIRADIAYGEETNQYRLHFSDRLHLLSMKWFLAALGIAAAVLVIARGGRAGLAGRHRGRPALGRGQGPRPAHRSAARPACRRHRRRQGCVRRGRHSGPRGESRPARAPRRAPRRATDHRAAPGRVDRNRIDRSQGKIRQSAAAPAPSPHRTSTRRPDRDPPRRGALSRARGRARARDPRT